MTATWRVAYIRVPTQGGRPRIIGLEYTPVAWLDLLA